MADVSTVLEKDTPDVIVRRENEVSHEVHKVDLENQRWPKPLESAQDLKRGRMILEKKEVLLFFRPTLARSFIKPERQLHFANSPN